MQRQYQGPILHSLKSFGGLENRRTEHLVGKNKIGHLNFFCLNTGIDSGEEIGGKRHEREVWS